MRLSFAAAISHGRVYRRLGLGPESRIHLLQNLLTGLVRHERIEASWARVDELRGYAEKVRGVTLLFLSQVWPEGAGSYWGWGRIGTALVNSAGSLFPYYRELNLLLWPLKWRPDQDCVVIGTLNQRHAVLVSGMNRLQFGIRGLRLTPPFLLGFWSVMLCPHSSSTLGSWETPTNEQCVWRTSGSR